MNALSLSKLSNGDNFSIFLLIIILIAAILLLWVCLRRERRNTRKLQEQQKKLFSRITVQEAMFSSIASHSKIKFFIGNVSEIQQSSGEHKLLAAFISEMLPADREKIMQKIHELFSGKIKSFQEKCILQINNSNKHHIFRGEIFDMPGQTAGKALFTNMDISELTEQTRELEDADSILKAIFDNLPGHIFIKNMTSDFSYVRCNPAFSGLVQLTPDNIVGKNDFDLFDNSLAQLIRNCDMNIASTYNIADNRWFFTTSDNKEHAIRFISRPLKQTDGTEWILGFGIDVARQERIAGKLRRRNKELRLLLAQLPHCAMLLDSKLNLACATPQMQQYFTASEKNDNSPLSCRQLCQCAVEDKQQCSAWQSLITRQSCVCVKSAFAGKQLHIKPLKNEEDAVNYLAVTLIDKNEEPKT